MILKEGKINIENLINKVSNIRDSERILKISEYFLDTPYSSNTLIGSAEIDEILTINFEGLDCMTLIEYVEALRLSTDFESFIKNLKLVRYKNGIVDFKNRRHFFSDWGSLKTVKNVTYEIGKSLCHTEYKKFNRIDAKRKWIEGLPVRLRKIIYIPIKHLSEALRNLNSIYYCGFFSLKEGLDVEHVGILFKKNNIPILRHASSIKDKVVDEILLEYASNKNGIILYKPIFK